MTLITTTEFCQRSGSPILRQKTRPYNNQQRKKGTCKIVDFSVPPDHRKN